MPTTTTFWQSPAEITRRLATPSPVLCYELAPTGRVHAGIVRTLMFAEEIRRELANANAKASIHLRINDFAAVKVGRVDSLAAGAPLIRQADGAGALTLLLDDLRQAATIFGFHLDRVVMVSDIYAEPSFRREVGSVMDHAAAVRSALQKHQSSAPCLFHPLCASCKRLYSAQLPPDSLTGRGTYSCNYCGHSDSFDAPLSEGLLTFKLESALIWKHVGASVDLHGLDHAQAYEASAAVAATLGIKIPLPGRVNLTFNQLGRKISKSRRNFVPVVDLARKQLDDLVQKLALTPWSEPINLNPEHCTTNE